MVQSPDGSTVASAAGDETLRFWNVFGTPEVAKAAPKAAPEPFAFVNRIRWHCGFVGFYVCKYNPHYGDGTFLKIFEGNMIGL